MRTSGVSFSITSHAAWAPGIATPEAWAQWSQAPFAIDAGAEPAVRAMPPMLRRRAGFLGKMALEVAYQCLDGRSDIPTVFCSRHGEAQRAVELLSDLARGEPLSPTGFGLAVHNASAGLFSIARADRANHIALAAGSSTIEHAVIEACGLLADGAPLVMLVAYDCGLPPVFARFEDCREQPHAWAWLMAPAAQQPIRLGWSAHPGPAGQAAPALPGGLEVLRFQLSGQREMQRVAGARCWTWTRGA
ncbi:MAG TPA: beta-ketoacyl synthase chain length factor [Telluria sp.]|nr:beta-ketoacyl synthase chain length factor [Telluria sp.]